MPLTHPRTFLAGLLLLFSVWLWPLPALGLPPFSAHMVMHMGVVAAAAPLLALGVVGGRLDPVRRWPRACSAVTASMLEFVVVWAWHAPQLHHFARHDAVGLLLEQGTFLAAGLLLWSSALGGSTRERRARSVSGVTGLLLTSMHMTLLGALLALTPRVLYRHASHSTLMSPLLDQHIGGVIMLVVGALSYLTGGLALVADSLLHTKPTRQR